MIKFPSKAPKPVDEATMRSVYERLRTPYKHGAVMKFDDELCDSPTVFRYGDAWYMSFIKIDKNTQISGYESHLARSTDLFNWEYLYPTLKRSDGGEWDAKQIAAYAAFVDNDFYGEYRLQKINGRYHFAYLGGNLDGYETDPLFMGQCSATDVLCVQSYTKFPSPILSPSDSDARAGENLTLYKAFMFKDEAQALGYPYVNVYNAKGNEHKESIFLAVSADGCHWERYGEHPIIFDDSADGSIRINGDPQILKLDGIYVMCYFVLQNGKAFNTFACSYDLINWTKWHGAPLIESEHDWENLYAHKPWIVVKDGVVYHYYCACNTLGERFIALATNKEV